jgi:hypothetical protein
MVRNQHEIVLAPYDPSCGFHLGQALELVARARKSQIVRWLASDDAAVRTFVVERLGRRDA